MANKTSKYFKYAIGEIILVVIGILIALSINNWNDHGAKVSQLKKDLTLVLQNLNLDTKQLKSNISNGKRYVKYQQNILTSTNDSLYDPAKLIDYLGTPNIDILNTGYNNLLNNNTFPSIFNDSLKTNLSIYYQSNLNKFEYYRRKMAELDMTINNYLLNNSYNLSKQKLSVIIKEHIANPIFRENYSRFLEVSTGTLAALKARFILSEIIKKQVKSELKRYD